MPLIEQMQAFFSPINKAFKVFKHDLGDAGYDLYATEDKWIFPFVITKIPCNCKVELPDGHFGLVTSRSGMSLRGNITIPGIIDSTYRGQISAIVTRIGLLPRKIKRGTRVSQLIVIPYREIAWKEREIATDTARGENGFGKSGEN